MAPINTKDLSEDTEPIPKTSKAPNTLSDKCQIFRRLVTVVSDNNIAHLNAGFMPPLQPNRPRSRQSVLLRMDTSAIAKTILEVHR